MIHLFGIYGLLLYLLDDVKYLRLQCINLPLKSRSPLTIASRMKPSVEGYIGGLHVYGWIEKGIVLHFRVGYEYSVKFKTVEVRDKLSSLKFKLRVPAGYVDGNEVWAATWSKTVFVVRSIHGDLHVEVKLGELKAEIRDGKDRLLSHIDVNDKQMFYKLLKETIANVLYMIAGTS